MQEIKTDEELPPGPALYITATPIGNLEDVTLRALRILRQADHVLTEDTRTTSRLLRRYGIETPLKSYRVHRLEEDTAWALARLAEKKNLCLCTDAGTPGISDPGSHLVRETRARLPEVPILPLPGPSALGAALSVAGFQTNPALYLGFLSPKAGRRRRALEAQRDFPGILVLFESVHRAAKTLGAIREIFPERDIFIAREMTKIHEEYVLAAPAEETRLEGLTLKGEFTLVIGPPRDSGKAPSVDE